MAFLGLATLVLLVIVGFLVAVRPGVLWRQIDFGVAPSWGTLLYAVPLAAAAFLGMDAVSSRAGKALRPGRDVPRAINVVLPLIVALAVGLAVVALSSLPVSSNIVPVDAATGLTRPVAGAPGRRVRGVRPRLRPVHAGRGPGGALGLRARHPRAEAHGRRWSPPRTDPSRACTARSSAAPTWRIPSWASSTACRTASTGSAASCAPGSPSSSRSPCCSPPTPSSGDRRASCTRSPGITRCRPRSAACTPPG